VSSDSRSNGFVEIVPASTALALKAPERHWSTVLNHSLKPNLRFTSEGYIAQCAPIHARDELTVNFFRARRSGKGKATAAAAATASK